MFDFEKLFEDDQAVKKEQAAARALTSVAKTFSFRKENQIVKPLASNASGTKGGLNLKSTSDSKEQRSSSETKLGPSSVGFAFPFVDKVTNTLEGSEPSHVIRQRFEEGLRVKVAKQKDTERISREAEQRIIDATMAKAKLPGVVDDISKKGNKGGWSGNFKKKTKAGDKFLSKDQAYDKGGNYQRQNLKKGYQEKTRAGFLKQRYYPNGKAKSFYKFKPGQDPQEEPLNNLDAFEPMQEDFIGIEKRTVEEQKVRIAENRHVDPMLLAEAETTLITKENMFFKLMNDGFKLLLLERSNLNQDQQADFDKKAAYLGKCAMAEYIPIGPQRDERWLTILHEYFGYPDFYPFQKQLLNRLNEGENCMADFFTGSGKSLIFQFFAVIHEGITIVLVPMLSLMVDQVKKIPANIPAICYNSWIPHMERAKIIRNLRDNRIKVLFVTPELFASDIVWYLLIFKIRVNLLCIDEAHCASVYSHSFRPSYALLEGYLDMLSKGAVNYSLKSCFDSAGLSHEDQRELLEIDEELAKEANLEGETMEEKKSIPISKPKAHHTGRIPILCLTATSSRETKYSVMRQFNIRDENYVNSSVYIRPNLGVTVSLEPQRIKDIARLVSMNSTKNMKPLLVYCNFNAVVNGVTSSLKQAGIMAHSFTGENDPVQKMNLLQQFLRTDPNHKSNPDDMVDMHVKIDCIVTTVSLAMGVDHRSIRGIIHYNMPGSLETYIQEIGRGGRDEKKAYCHLFLHDGDYFFQRSKRLTDCFLDKATLRKIIKFLMGRSSTGGVSGWKYKKQWGNKKVNGKEVQLADTSKQLWSYIKSSSTKVFLKIEKSEFLNILHVFREMLRHEYKVDFEYSIDVMAEGYIEAIKYTHPDFDKNSLIRTIKANSRKIRDGYKFNIVQIANKIEASPLHLKVSLMELAQKLQFKFRSSEYSIAFMNLKHDRFRGQASRLDVEELVGKLYQRNLDLIRETCCKVDSFYMLLRSQAVKQIKDFTDGDIATPRTEMMEPYVQLYFTEGSAKMIERMQADGVCKHLPIIYMHPTKPRLTARPAMDEEYNPKVFRGMPLQVATCDTTEAKDVISALIAKHRDFLRSEMANDKTYSKVFRDFLKMITEQTSSHFDRLEWERSEFYGIFKHYDLVDALEELESLFELFYKDMNGVFEEVVAEAPGAELYDDPPMPKSQDLAESEAKTQRVKGEPCSEDEEIVFQEDSEPETPSKAGPQVDSVPLVSALDDIYLKVGQDDEGVTKPMQKQKKK